MLTVCLNKVRFFAHHGLHDEEGSLGNEFEIDLTVKMDPGISVIHHIQETINYVQLFELVSAQMKRPRKLLETLVMEIVEEIHHRFPQSMEINITITKLNPPIHNFQGQVCVNYSKAFH